MHGMEFRNLLFKKLQKISLHNVISMSFVGSTITEKDFKNVGDIDIIIILKKLDYENYSKLIIAFQQFIKDISYREYKFHLETRRGTIKPDYKDKNEKQLHLFVYDPEIWNGINKNALYEWTYHNQNIMGKELRKITKRFTLTKEDALQDITRFLNELENKTILISRYTLDTNKNQLIKKKLYIKSENQSGTYHAVWNTLIGALIYARLHKKISNSKKDLLSYARLNEKKFYDHIKKAYELKYRLKSHEKISNSEAREFRDDSIMFIKYIKNRLKNSSSD
jgi:hypothetical protein